MYVCCYVASQMTEGLSIDIGGIYLVIFGQFMPSKSHQVLACSFSSETFFGL
jgi:hypothetical protein